MTIGVDYWLWVKFRWLHYSFSVNYNYYTIHFLWIIGIVWSELSVFFAILFQPSTNNYCLFIYSLPNTSQCHMIFLIINLFRFVLIHRNYFKNDQPQNNPLHSCWFLNRYHNRRRLTYDCWHHEQNVRPTLDCWCLPLLPASHCPISLLLSMWTQWSWRRQPCLH